MDTEALLKQGITAAQAGHKAEAWRLLAQVLHQDQRNELAWYWLSRVVDSQKQCVKCLKNVLMINPDNASARKKLAQLQGRADAPQAPPQPSTPPPTIRCLNCGATNRTGATFCKKCGQSLNQTKSSPATAPPVVLCPQCGAKNRVEAAFCSGCGQRLVETKSSPQAKTRCPSCGFENLDAFRFCSKCGQELRGEGEPAAPSPDTSQSARPRPQRAAAETAPAPASPPKSNNSATHSDWPNAVFCLNCGKKNLANVSVCAQCNTPIVTVPLHVVKHLIDVVCNDKNQETRVTAIHALGRLKARQAIPVLLEIARKKGFKRTSEIGAAKYAMTQILDLSASYNTCSACENDNPSTAKFCGYCGRPTTRAAATEQELTRLITQVQNYSSVFPVKAIQKLGQTRSSTAKPVLIKLFRKLRKGLKDHFELLVVLEALADIGEPDPALIKEIIKTARRWRAAHIPVTASCLRALYRLGARKEVDNLLCSLIQPQSKDEQGVNLLYVLKFGEMLSDTERIIWLTSQIRDEQKKWKSSVGFTFLAFDPVTLLISTVLTSANVLLQRHLIGRDKKRAKMMASWMVTPAMLNPYKFEKLPVQIRLMMALHCYSNALSKLAFRDQASVQLELKECKRSIERAVISFALAQNGDTGILNNLTKLSGDRDWATRILAYEGLVTLNSASRALKALQDRDLRVRTSVAQAMASCGDTGYIPHILALSESTDKAQRQAILPIIAQMAQNGVPAAKAKLQYIANKDEDKKARDLAATYMKQLKSASQ